MKLHAATIPATKCSAVAIDTLASELWVVTTVLQDDAGPLGFELRGGKVAAALVGDGVLLPCTNHPEWTPTVSQIIDGSIHPIPRRSVSCTNPSPALLAELKAVVDGTRQRQANAVRERHGVPAKPAAVTKFDDWVLNDGCLRLSVVDWLVSESDAVGVWSFSDWGVFARWFGRTEGGVIARLSRICDQQGVTLVRATDERGLPSW